MPRFHDPEHLLGATNFSVDAELGDPVWLIRTLRQTAWAYGELERAVAGLESHWARRREPGAWALAYVAFCTSRLADIQPWHAQSPAELWRECGFAAKPPYSRVYARFVELEQLSGEFEATAARLIRHARRHEPRIGRHWHVDSTEAETHAALVHVCCGGRHSGARPGRRPPREATRNERGRRHEADELPPPRNPVDLRVGVNRIVDRADARYMKISGHWYKTLDKTAGVRSYARSSKAIRFWHGYYSQKAIDHYTGAPLAIETHSASEAEFHAYPRLFERACENLGDQPETVIADRGFSVASVFEHNTHRGVASVMPYRRHGRHRQRPDREGWDRHGVPRCRHCGAATDFRRFSAGGGSPRLWVLCRLGQLSECQREQTISCAEDWRFLVPLWRTEALYHELRASHERYERVQHHWRERYLVGPDNVSCRPKRRGIGWQRLRAAAALLCEWLRICHREGWLGSARSNRGEPGRYPERGERAAVFLNSYRTRIGLNIPYGRKAERLGFGHKDPPSRRERAGP